MPVPTVVTDLSATAASNSPASNESPGDGDNHIQTAYAFIKQSYDGTLTNLFRVNSDGVPYGTAIHNPAGTLTGTTNQLVCSGTYTPTLTNTTNVASSTANAGQWIRVGNVVHVAGSVAINPTSASALTEIEISLPIASNIAGAANLRGTAVRVSSGAQYIAGVVFGDAAADTASLQFYCDSDAGDATWSYTFSYVIL